MNNKIILSTTVPAEKMVVPNSIHFRHRSGPAPFDQQNDPQFSPATCFLRSTRVRQLIVRTLVSFVTAIEITRPSIKIKTTAEQDENVAVRLINRLEEIRRIASQTEKPIEIEFALTITGIF